MDFDGNRRGADNAANVPSHPPSAVIYYSLVQTQTHPFLGYYFYRAASYDETSPGTFSGHEHDFEGLMWQSTTGQGVPKPTFTAPTCYLAPDTPGIRPRRQHPDGYHDQPQFTLLPRLL